LIPKEADDEEEVDPREELMLQLLEYKKYKNASEELRDKMALAQKSLYKSSTVPEEVLEYEQPVDLSELLSGVDLSRLEVVFQDVLKRRDERRDPVRSRFGTIEQEEFSLEDKMTYVERYATAQGSFSFRKLLEAGSGKMEMIVTFLAVLELMKMGKIAISQKEIFEDILIEAR
jgi:segregation and condensation protein A